MCNQNNKHLTSICYDRNFSFNSLRISFNFKSRPSNSSGNLVQVGSALNLQHGAADLVIKVSRTQMFN